MGRQVCPALGICLSVGSVCLSVLSVCRFRLSACLSGRGSLFKNGERPPVHFPSLNLNYKAALGRKQKLWVSTFCRCACGAVGLRGLVLQGLGFRVSIFESWSSFLRKCLLHKILPPLLLDKHVTTSQSTCILSIYDQTI